MAKLYSSKRNANYDFEKKKEPERNMGLGDFANLPTSPKLKSFSNKHDYRDGIINSFTCSVEEISDIDENER